MPSFPDPIRPSASGPRARPGRRAVIAAVVVAAGLLAMTVSPVGATYPGAADAPLALTIKDAAGNPQINIVSSDGLTETPLTSTPFFNACPAFSVDGTKIAYCSNASGAFEIWTMNADGTSQAQLTHLGGKATFPDFSPDGTKVAFGATEGTDPQNQVYTVDAATGGSLTALTSCAAFKPGCFNDVPAWSPDGTQIVYTHADDSDADGNAINEQVWVMGPDGGNAHALTTGTDPKDQVPDWSPDGTKIVYASGPGGSEGIWVMNADGSDPHQLTGCAATDPAPCAAGDDFGPSWSADGTQIGFIRDTGSAAERPVMIMNADGTDVHRLTPASTPQVQYVPTWQPGGAAATN